MTFQCTVRYVVERTAEGLIKGVRVISSTLEVVPPEPPMVVHVQGDQWTDEYITIDPSENPATGPIERPNRDA